MRPTAENELPLSSWLADVGRRWYAWITAVLAVFQISLPGLLRLIRTLKPDRDPEVWVLTLLHGLQAGVVLALLVVLYKPRYATPGRGMHHAEPIAQSQERFIVYWRYVWVSWFLLYAMLMGFSFAVQNRIDAQFNDPKQPFHEAFYNDLMKVTGRDRATAAPEYQKKGDAAKGAGPWQEVNERYVRRAIEAREARGGPGGWDAEGPVGARLAVLRPMLRYRDLAENTLNNFQTLAIFLCYFALAPGPMPSGRRPVRSPTPYGIILLSLLAFLQFFGVLGDLPGAALSYLGTISSVAGGTVMALLVGRLESRRFGASTALIAVFYTYAVLQTGWVLDRDPNVVPDLTYVVYTSYLVMKVLLFLYVLWLLQSGRMLYYFHVTFALAPSEEHSRAEFFRHLDLAGDGAPPTPARRPRRRGRSRHPAPTPAEEAAPPP